MSEDLERTLDYSHMTQLKRFVPEQSVSEIVSPLNTPAKLLSDVELQERRVALDAISRIRNKPIPNIGVN